MANNIIARFLMIFFSFNFVLFNRTLAKWQKKIIKREGEQDPVRLRMYHHIMDVIAAVILCKDALINSPVSYFKLVHLYKFCPLCLPRLHLFDQILSIIIIIFLKF